MSAATGSAKRGRSHPPQQRPIGRDQDSHYIELRNGMADTERNLDPAEYARKCRRLARLAGI